MNKNNIAVLILLVAIVALIAYVAGNAVLGGRTSKSVEVEQARPISADVVKPEKDVFNVDAINPTVQITIGDNNQNPIGN